MDDPGPSNNDVPQTSTSHNRPSLSLEMPHNDPQNGAIQGMSAETLEAIHAHSSTNPGLTTFGLGSPTTTQPDNISLSGIFTRVKSVAQGVKYAVRDAVVVGGGSPIMSVLSNKRPSSSRRVSGMNGHSESRSQLSRVGSAAASSAHSFPDSEIISPFDLPTTPSTSSTAQAKQTIPTEQARGYDVERSRHDQRNDVEEDGVDSDDGLVLLHPRPIHGRASFDSKSRTPPKNSELVFDVPPPESDEEEDGEVPPVFANDAARTDFDATGEILADVEPVGLGTSPPTTRARPSIDEGSPSRERKKRPRIVTRPSENHLLPGFSAYQSDGESSPTGTTGTSAGAPTTFGDPSSEEPGPSTTSKPTESTPGPKPPTTSTGALSFAGWFRGDKRSEQNGNYAVSRSNGVGVSSGGFGSNTEAVAAALRQIRNGNLSKDFWMKDENCKECFHCLANFTTFRRRHHCRTCGQIFCSKCTTLIPGERFGHSGSMRVCLKCLEIVNEYQDTESDSDEYANSIYPTANGSDGISAGNAGFNMPTDHKPTSTPLMAIPATRRTAANNPNRRSQILEISEVPSPPRPPSVRSGKVSLGGIRPITAGSVRQPHHKHTYSRSYHRWPGMSPNKSERAPFHGNAAEEVSGRNRLTGFHNDQVIDPELAPYMSDPGDSEEEHPSIFSVIAPRFVDTNGKPISTPSGGNGGDKTPASTGGSISNAFSAARARSKHIRSTSGSISNMLSLAIGGAGSDVAGSVSRSATHTKTRKRNSSFATTLHPRPATRGSKSHWPGMRKDQQPELAESQKTASVPLNAASLKHVRNLMHQLLEDAGVGEPKKWEDAIIPILLKATDDLNPDIRNGDDIDIRQYVKVKRIPGATPGHSTYVSGVVFSKNLALKSMPRSITNPRIVLVSFPIEYSRGQQFMSLEPVIGQEKEYLQNMVNRILALRPQLLLVEENISRLALQYLEAAGIATAFNVKPSVIEAVSRCAQADIFSSVDRLAIPHFRVGNCARFDVKTYMHEDIPTRKKTFIFLDGCQKELGCTIVLRGADMRTLATVKQITELMVYVVYNLKLETCLMTDEFVAIPSQSVGTLVVPPPEATDVDPTTATLSTSEAPYPASPSLSAISDPGVQPGRPDDELIGFVLPNRDGENLIETMVTPSYYEDMVRKHETKILSASPFVKYMQPYLLARARELERRLIQLRQLKERDIKLKEALEANKDPESKQFLLVQPEMVHGDLKETNSKILEVLLAIHDAEYDKACHFYETQKRQWENYLSQYDDLFDPFEHQCIVLLYSLVNSNSGVPCEMPEIRRLEYYHQNQDWFTGRSDCTLGQYIEFLCDTANRPCIPGICDAPMSDHHRSYVHGDARISVLVKDKPDCPIKGMENSILMWSYCKICTNVNTPPIRMSADSWKYSLAKYLELAFWSSGMKLRAGICPHDLNRHHVRCFAYHGWTVLFQYDPVDLFEIVVPRVKLTYKPELDLRMKNEQYVQNEEKITRFFDSVRNRLNFIKLTSVVPEKLEQCRTELERLKKQVQDDKDFCLGALRDAYTNSKYYEIIPFSHVIKAVQVKVLEWEGVFTAFENTFLPSEKDIRALASQQLKQLLMLNNKESGHPIPQEDPYHGGDLGTASKAPSVKDDKLETVAGETSASEIGEKHQEEKGSTPGSNSVDEPVLSTADGKQHPEGNAEAKIDKPDERSDANLEGRVEDKPEGKPIGKPGEKTEEKTEERKDSAPDRSKAKTPDIAGVPMQRSISSRPSDNASTTSRLTAPTAASESRRLSSNIPSRKTSISRKKGSIGSNADLQPPSPAQADFEDLAPIRRVISNASTTSTETGKSPSTSSIPRSSLDLGRRGPIPPSLPRTVSSSQVPLRREVLPPHHRHHVVTMPMKKAAESFRNKAVEKLRPDRKMVDRLKPGKKSRETESKIPRSVPQVDSRPSSAVMVNVKDGKGGKPRVLSFANHFEQLSREFEKERIKEKKKLLAKRPKAILAASRPIVEVFKDAETAAKDEDVGGEVSPTTNEPDRMVGSVESGDKLKAYDSEPEPEPTATGEVGQEGPDPPAIELPEGSQSEERPPPTPNTAKDSDIYGSDEERSTFGDTDSSSLLPSISDVLRPVTEVLDDQHGRSSLMKVLSNFWNEKSSSGWPDLEWPLTQTDHIFADSDVIVREDEPSSLIAFTLSTADYKAKLEAIRANDNSIASSMEGSMYDIPNSELPDLERSLHKDTGTHLKYQFQEGAAKMYCKIFFAEHFDALRQKCGLSDRFVESLSRCLKWDSKGGKTKSVFLKTLDDRIVMKALQPVETTAFLKFAHSYFKFMSEAFFHELPTVIAKMLGFFQIYIKNPNTGTEIKWDVLVMENLFYDHKTTRKFDLKGSMRNRYAQPNGNMDEVLLDENMVEYIYESPLFVREHSKKLLRASLWNDTLYLSKQNVMDYSLMIGFDEEKKELIVGIIDCIRTYTWDKKFEFWLKSGVSGGQGGRAQPTITSPKEYKWRFREAMQRYILEAPNCWHLFRMQFLPNKPGTGGASGSGTQANAGLVGGGVQSQTNLPRHPHQEQGLLMQSQAVQKEKEKESEREEEEFVQDRDVMLLNTAPERESETGGAPSHLGIGRSETED